MRLLIIAHALLLSGCLVTRGQLREQEQRRETQNQVVAMQQARYQDLDSMMRQLNGRVETLEHALQTAQAEKAQIEAAREAERRENETKFKIYEEALAKMEQQYLTLSQKVEALSVQRETPKTTSSKNTFEQGEDEFKRKNYRAAITSYQRYREKNPKGKNYAEATYKIGVSFQELGMKDDALPFFNEVVEKFPKSKSAEKAKIRLKQLK